MSAHIIAAFRTAVMPRGGAFAHLEAHELAAPLVSACLDAAGIRAGQVDEIILGNAIGPGGNPARLVALLGGLPERVAGLTIDRQCAGGLDALLLAKALIESGHAGVVLAGGMESYSRRPLRLRTALTAGEAPVAYDQPPFTPWPDRDPGMTVAAAALARRLAISRAEQDVWAVASHAKALAARTSLRPEIVALQGLSSQDDAFTRVLSKELAARAPSLVDSITSANTAVAADAAALCLVVSEEIATRAAKALPFSGITLGDQPDLPGLAPIAAIRETLRRAGLSPDRLTTIEIMEAYAAQAIACVRGAGLDPARVNLKGGALARGHPIGASGAILATRLFHDLAPGDFGLAAIAAAGGIGTALLMEG